MEYLPQNEVSIVTNLIYSILLNKELAICVRDEEAIAVKTTRDAKKIFEAIGNTELTILKIKKITENKTDKRICAEKAH